MASPAELLDWQPAGRGSGYVFMKGKQFRFQREGFSSDAFSSLAEANRLGWAQYWEWCKKLQLPKGVNRDRHHAEQAVVKKPAPATGQKRKAQELLACSRDQQDAKQQQPWGSSAGNPAAAAAAATEGSTPGVRKSKKRRTAERPAAAAAAMPRNKQRAAAAEAAAARPAPRFAWMFPPTAAAAAAVPQEGAGSNCASPAATAGLAPALAASVAMDPAFPSSMTVWRPGSSTESGKRLQLRFEDTLGRGGFGEVHKVSVKLHGPDSLSTLKLRGNAAAAVRQLLASLDSSTSTSSSMSSRNGASSGSNVTNSFNSITMALKLAPPFIFTSGEMQLNHQHDPLRYNEHVKQRMLAAFNIMQSCAASPHIVDAFVAGTVLHYGTYLPALLMEFATHGDVEQAFLAQKLPAPWGLAEQQRYPGPYVRPAQQQHQRQQQQQGIPWGLSSTVTQHIVRAAAMGLRDLHRMSGHLHCDIKTNNLLVFGSADNPVIKLCDLGVCKRRCSELKCGPVSGTKDWQAPEQAGAAGGPLDFCLDSWGLGLLVLGLRRGRRPFWWLQDVGVTPAEFAPSLAASLGRPDSRYAQEDASQPGAPLGPMEVAFVQRCMAHSSARQPPELLLQNDPYLSGRYRGS